MSAIKHLPLESVSEIFVNAATDILKDKGFDVTTDHAKRLRAEVIRRYEIALQEQQQSALFNGISRDAREVAQEKVKSINSYIGPYLDMHRDPN